MKIFVYIFFILFSFSITKCSNNPKSYKMVSKIINIDTLNCSMFEGHWKISNSMTSNSMSYGVGKVFRFSNMCSYTIKLDVNLCGAPFEIFDDNSIKFSSPTCTELCCDTEFSMSDLSLLTMINQVTYINSDTICLSGITTKEYSTNGILTNTSMQDVVLKIELIKQRIE